MSVYKLIFTYSARLLWREWRRFVLPFLSLSITALVLVLILLLTSSGANLLAEKARELQGGDVVLESAVPIESALFWQAAGIQPERESKQLSFSGTLQSPEATAPFSLQVVDANFPLYGQVLLVDSPYRELSDSEVLIDAAGAERLGVAVGDTVTFGELPFTIAGIISAEPTALFGGFQFLPRGIMSQAGFKRSLIDPALLRAEYRYAGKFSTLSSSEIELLRQLEDTYIPAVDLDIAGQDQRGLQFGLETVSDFLTVAVLITAVLAAVNVYASTLYLVTVERKSLAILLALGLRKSALVALLGTALGYVVIIASGVGVLLGSALFTWLSAYISTTYLITLPNPAYVLYALASTVIIVTIATAAFIPAVKKSLALNPKQILIGGDESLEQKVPLRTLLLLTTSTLLPLVIFASFLLQDIVDGTIVISLIAVVYVVTAGLFALALSGLYQKRARFSFFVRSIISQKKADGLFGIVAFTSLFVALVSLGTLALLQISLERFLTEDLARTVPTTYVLDIQPSQKESVQNTFPELELFANIGARIIAIDDLRVQEELEKGTEGVDRELGREFNLTPRAELLSSETVVAGTWAAGKSGEISVDEDFASQANIKLGSKLVFSIQGFEVSGVVTSLRSTDSRSGLPFFYFVLSPEDISSFPGVYFGYAYYTSEKQRELGRFLASKMPNVSLLETQAVGLLLAELVGTLLLLVLIVTLPPLLIATLLIATLVVSSYAARRREGARLRAIGITRGTVLRQYLIETISLTFAATVISYGVSIIIANLISIYFLGLESVTLFDPVLFLGLGLIVIIVGLIGLYLFKTDTMPLRELLSYESNN